MAELQTNHAASIVTESMPPNRLAATAVLAYTLPGAIDGVQMEADPLLRLDGIVKRFPGSLANDRIDLA